MYLFLALWSVFSVPVPPFGANNIKHKRTCLRVGQDGAKSELKYTSNILVLEIIIKGTNACHNKIFCNVTFFSQDVKQGNYTTFTDSLNFDAV